MDIMHSLNRLYDFYLALLGLYPPSLLFILFHILLIFTISFPFFPLALLATILPLTIFLPLSSALTPKWRLIAMIILFKVIDVINVLALVVE